MAYRSAWELTSRVPVGWTAATASPTGQEKKWTAVARTEAHTRVVRGTLQHRTHTAAMHGVGKPRATMRGPGWGRQAGAVLRPRLMPSLARPSDCEAIKRMRSVCSFQCPSGYTKMGPKTSATRSAPQAIACHEPQRGEGKGQQQLACVTGSCAAHGPRGSCAHRRPRAHASLLLPALRPHALSHQAPVPGT